MRGPDACPDITLWLRRPLYGLLYRHLRMRLKQVHARLICLFGEHPLPIEGLSHDRRFTEEKTHMTLHLQGAEVAR